MGFVDDIPIFALLFGASVAWNGYRKGSLSKDGALAAFLVGSTMLSTKLRAFGVTLLVFYFIGSRATRVGKSLKAKLEDGVRAEGGQRDAVQVLCNSLSAFIACVVWRIMFTSSYLTTGLPSWRQEPYDGNRICALSPQLGGGWSRFLLLVALGQFGCCLGDTLASELGILSKSRPILITTLKPVPPGTNGGMSILGTAVSIIGGGVVGLTMVLVLLIENSACRNEGYRWALDLILLGLFSGGFGSLLDSFLGATVQQTLYSKEKKRILTEDSVAAPGAALEVISGWNILTNNQVNLVSSTITAILTGYLG